MSKFKIYDEDDNFIGEYVGEFVEEVKETVTYSSSSDASLGSILFAILCIFAFKFPWLIIVIIAWGILKLLWIVTKFVGRIAWWLLRFSVSCLWWILQEVVYGIWWLVRVPITLALDKNVPYWWFPNFRLPKWQWKVDNTLEN